MKTTTMKQIVLLFAVLLAFTANAQTVRKNPKPAVGKAKGSVDSTQINDLNQRVADLINEVDSLCQIYNGMNDKWFQGKAIDARMKDVKQQCDKAKESMENANTAIDSIKEEMAWIDELLKYYDSHSLDELYRGDGRHPCASVPTLKLHQKLLGTNYPKKIDDLLLLAESASSLKEEYDAEKNKRYQNGLKLITGCDTKWNIDGLLAVHGYIKDELDKGKGSEISTLKELMEFEKYLMNEYGVDLDADFPYLAKQAWAKLPIGRK